MRYELADYEWAAIKPMLPNKPRGVPRVNDRRILNGIFWVLRSGAPWRDLPDHFGPYTTCYNRFVRWRRVSVWGRIIDALAKKKDRIGWPEAKAFAREICLQMAADSPSRYLINMAKKERVGRIFLDYLRNDRMATAVAPLSPRARDGAPVSMPVTWSQVKKGLDPLRFTIRTAPALIAKSAAWKEYCDSERSLSAAIKRIVKKKRVA